MPNYYTDQLETNRFSTRHLTKEDISAWSRFFEDKEAVEFFPDHGLSSAEERAGHWIERQLARYAEQRYGLQALIEKDTADFIGQCGLLLQEVDGVQELEVGYHIFKKYWGQGFAPEVAKLFIDYAFRNKLSDSVISIIHTGNVKSQRVAEKNGLLREKQTTWAGIDVYIYRIRKT